MSISIRTLVKDKYLYRTLGLTLGETVEVKNTSDNKGVQLFKPKIIQHSGKPVEGAEDAAKLGQGKIYELDFGTVQSQKDLILVSVNPALGLTCVVSNPGVLCAKALHKLSFPVYTIKQTDLAELDWLVALYVLA